MVAAICKSNTSPPVTGWRRSKSSHPPQHGRGWEGRAEKISNPVIAAIVSPALRALRHAGGWSRWNRIPKDFGALRKASWNRFALHRAAENLTCVERINQNIRVNNARSTDIVVKVTAMERAYRPEMPNWQFQDRSMDGAFVLKQT